METTVNFDRIMYNANVATHTWEYYTDVNRNKIMVSAGRWAPLENII